VARGNFSSADLAAGRVPSGRATIFNVTFSRRWTTSVQIMNAPLPAPDATEADLINQAAAGDRQAFGLLVEQYQSLICSLAYSGTGDLARSQDLAQETFIAAWNQLASLRERTRFKAWLCGIARNLVNSSHRRDARQGPFTHLDEAHEVVASAKDPLQSAVSREEAALVWQCLEQMPETYREPLILFYREQESVLRVAAALDLSEDAVRQRLSRGRSLLREKLVALVETTLARTRPGKAFTYGVLAALPGAKSAATITGLVASATKGAASVGLAGGLGGALLGLLGGAVGGGLGAYASLQQARSHREKAFIKRLVWLQVGITAVFTVGSIAVPALARPFIRSHPLAYGLGLAVWIIAYLLALGFIILWSVRRHRQIRLETSPDLPQTEFSKRMARLQHAVTPAEYRSRTSFLGWPVVHIAFGGMEQGEYRKGVARGWIAIGDRAHGLLLAVGGVALGGIAVGGLAVGVIALGGAAIGLAALGGGALGFVACGGGALGAFALGGGALGLFAAGGLAVGWSAYGGGAIAWRAARGGFACARDFAVGGSAFAAHANDEAARAVVASDAWLNSTQHILDSYNHHQSLAMTILGILILLQILGTLAAQRFASKRSTKQV